MTQATTTIRDRVAIVTMANPPVNGLGHALRSGILARLREAEGNADVDAIVLTGDGAAFSGGADIREFNTPKALAAPNLRELIAEVEKLRKPVVAAIHSVAMGGGLELAMGCHYRVAIAGAQIALPEVKLGILPGAGGTQRLPRLVPLAMATNMIVSGTPVRSEKFQGTRLFDAIIEGDLVAGAVAFARKVVDDKRGLPRVRDLSVKEPDAEAFARNTARTVAPNLPAPVACIDAIAATISLPFDEGLKNERRLFNELVQSPESHALRHAFFGERSVSKIPDVPSDTPKRDIRQVAIIGAGTMGGGIAMNFLNVGIPVTILETSQEALDRGVGIMRKNYEATVRKGRLKAEEAESRMARLTTTLAYEDIAATDLVIEAVFEDMAVKEQVFRKLDTVLRPGTILATNTSTLDVNRIAGFTQRPQDVIGMHFFSPANVMRLLEVVRGARTGKDVLATVMALAKRIRKTAVVSGVCDGFIGNRMVEQYFRQAGFLVEEGASPQQVDRAIERWGFAMGPFRMGDMAGNDVGWYIRKRRYLEYPDIKYPSFLDKVCELGRFGQKTGAGVYRYAPGKRDALPDPEIEALLRSHRESLGVKPREIGDDEIVDRLIFALVNEGARLLEEGIALRASDIDMVYLTGYGFPVHRGGPMLTADLRGLPLVVDRMKQFAANPFGDPRFWTPAPLLATLAAEGKTFNG